MNLKVFNRSESKSIAKKIMQKVILPIMSVALFSIAFWVLYHELKNFNFHEIIRYFCKLPFYRLLLSFFSSVLSYLMLIEYDFLGMKYIGHSFKYWKIAPISYISYAFSNTIGYSFLSGGFVRYRFYSSWGLSPKEIAKVIVFCIFSSFLGFFALAGFSFLLKPQLLLLNSGLSDYPLRLIGIFFILIVAVYISMVYFIKKRPSIKEHKLLLPSKRLVPLQLLIAFLDWAFAAFTFYFLLPPDLKMSMLVFMNIFMVGQFVGLVSHVPGGIGVFEATIILLMKSMGTHSQIVGALLSFRLIYYFVPLAIGLIIYVYLGSTLGVKQNRK